MVSTRTVSHAIAWLSLYGFLDKLRRIVQTSGLLGPRERQTSNAYVLCFPKGLGGLAVAALKISPERNNCPPSRSNSAAKKLRGSGARSRASRPYSGDVNEIPLQKKAGVLLLPRHGRRRAARSLRPRQPCLRYSRPAEMVKSSAQRRLTAEDFTGQLVDQLADGTKVPSQTFRIRSLRTQWWRSHVTGSVGAPHSPAILGQSFFSRASENGQSTTSGNGWSSRYRNSQFERQAGESSHDCSYRLSRRTVRPKLFPEWLSIARRCRCARWSGGVMPNIPAGFPAGMASGGSCHADTINSYPTHPTSFADLRDHAVRLMKRRGDMACATLRRRRQRQQRRTNHFRFLRVAVRPPADLVISHD